MLEIFHSIVLSATLWFINISIIVIYMNSDFTDELHTVRDGLRHHILSGSHVSGPIYSRSFSRQIIDIQVIHGVMKGCAERWYPFMDHPGIKV